MKEAIIIGLDGFMTDVILVEDAVTGVSPIVQVTPAVLDGKGKEITPESKVETGHQVAVKVPEGLYKPKWDSVAESWVEGLSSAELQLRKNPPDAYKEKRRAEYPPMGDQLDAIWKSFIPPIGSEAELMKKRIDDIKVKYPKA